MRNNIRFLKDFFLHILFIIINHTYLQRILFNCLKYKTYLDTYGLAHIII